MKKSLLLLTAMLMSLATAFADNITLQLNATASQWNGDAKGFTTTIDGFEVSYLKHESTNNAIAPSDDHIRVYKNAQLSVKGLNGQTITGMVLHVTATKYAISMTPATGEMSADTEAQAITWTGSTSNFSAVASEGQVRISSIDITYTAGDVKVQAPQITGNTQFEGSTEVTITGEAGTTIYYTIDGTEPTTASPLTGASPLTFTLNKTATVKAIAVKGADASTASQKDFELVEHTHATIASLNELSNDQPFMLLTLKDAKVVYVDGTKVYVREGEKALMFFNIGFELPQDAVLNGTVKVDYDNYYGIHEVKANSFTAATDLTITPSTEAAVPTVAKISSILAFNHIADYVLVEKATIEADGNKYFAVQGTDRIQLYKGTDVSAYANDGKEYYITAVFNNIYNSAAQLQPIVVTADKITAIDNIVTNEAAKAIFTLDGRRLEAPVKGINIINGKKVLVK